ncbi:MAG: hypothetical protein WAO19_05220 [Candidatus Kryptoniota bacterium]
MKTSQVILLAVLFAACSKSSSNSMTPPSGNINFSSQVQPIFTANCALSGCHAGSSPQQGQNLSAGQAYSNIVSVRSAEAPSFFRVNPSNSDSSYLYMKITGDPRIGNTARMPYGKSPLGASDIQTIKNWIDQGALNN